MIGGDGVDRPVLEPRHERRDVVAAAERWIHLVHRIHRLDGRVREAEVMWGDLCGDGQAIHLGGANQSDRLGATHVLDVISDTGFRNERQISRNDGRLSDRRQADHPENRRYGTLVHMPISRESGIFGVLRHDGVATAQILHRPAENACVGEPSGRRR